MAEAGAVGLCGQMGRLGRGGLGDAMLVRNTGGDIGGHEDWQPAQFPSTVVK